MDCKAATAPAALTLMMSAAAVIRLRAGDQGISSAQDFLPGTTMKIVALVILAVAVVAAAPQGAYDYQEPVARGPQYPDAPAQYNFQWDVNDQPSGNFYGHQEQRDGDNTQGSYYVRLPDTRLMRVDYYVDQTGYHPTVTFEGEAQYPSAPARGYSQPAPAPSQGYSQPAPAPSQRYSQPAPAPRQPVPAPSQGYSQPAPAPRQPVPAPSQFYATPGK
ncbi:cuticle protein 7 [Procambarus clarkii]|uniref:cuticle protein 7 n=1 Tax=Procambarus clarkii TaxID=6728 RepID=UPI0037434553